VVELIYLTHKSNNWLPLVKTTMYLRVPQNTGTYTPAQPLLLSQESISSTELN